MCNMSQLGVLESVIGGSYHIWLTKIPALKIYSPWSNDRELLGRGSVPNAKRKARFRVLITLIFKTRLSTASHLPSL